jgi:hypothetical protein
VIRAFQITGRSVAAGPRPGQARTCAR